MVRCFMLRPGTLDPVQRNQHGVAFAMILLASELSVRCGKKLKRTLSSTFLVATAQTVELLPQAKLDDGHRHAGAGDHRLDGADRTPILEARALEPCRGIACPRSMEACCGACWVIRFFSAMVSTRCLALIPVSGMSVAAMSCGDESALISKITTAPEIPATFIRRLGRDEASSRRRGFEIDLRRYLLLRTNYCSPLEERVDRRPAGPRSLPLKTHKRDAPPIASAPLYLLRIGSGAFRFCRYLCCDAARLW